jgi:hypothetical protein
MPYFDVKDKTGRTIHITKEQWSHIQKHPEMSNSVEQIKETLMHPITITSFEYDSQVGFYYRFYKERKDYLLVLVKYLNGNGFVITAFYTDKIK